MPQPSRHRNVDLSQAYQALRERGVDPAYVAMLCVRGQHERCKQSGGKVRVAREEGGHRYVRCECPDCVHPAVQIRRTSAQ